MPLHEVDFYLDGPGAEAALAAPFDAASLTAEIDSNLVLAFSHPLPLAPGGVQGVGTSPRRPRHLSSVEGWRDKGVSACVGAENTVSEA